MATLVMQVLVVAVLVIAAQAQLLSKTKPGEVIDQIDQSSVDKALSEVLKDGGVSNRRRCAIGVANEGNRTLTNPTWWLSAGTNGSEAGAGPVGPSQTGLDLYYTLAGTSGTGGVLTYDIDGTDLKVALLWSVPLVMTVSNIWFNVKVYPASYETGEHMYGQMYEYAGAWSPGSWQRRTEYGVTLRASMTYANQAKLSVWVNTEAYDPEGHTEVNKECSYNALWFGKYCWQECSPTGWCWVNQKCGGKDACQRDNMMCYSDCKDVY